MRVFTVTTKFKRLRRARVALGSLLIMAATHPALAAGCSFAPQGDGHVTEIVDARTFRLQDGRDVDLIGIEPVVDERQQDGPHRRFIRIVAGHDVTLRGDDDTPDRYGRQPAFVFLDRLRHIGAG